MLSISKHVEHWIDFCGKRSQQNWRALKRFRSVFTKNAVGVVKPIWGQELKAGDLSKSFAPLFFNFRTVSTTGSDYCLLQPPVMTFWG